MGGRPLHRWGIARLAQLRNLPVSKTGAAGSLRRAKTRYRRRGIRAERGPRRPCVHWVRDAYTLVCGPVRTLTQGGLDTRYFVGAGFLFGKNMVQEAKVLVTAAGS